MAPGNEHSDDDGDQRAYHGRRHARNVGQLAAEDPESYSSKQSLIAKSRRDLEDGEKGSSAKTTTTTKKTVSSSAQTFLQRIDHLTWANFTLPMATGGLALLIGQQPHAFRGLQTIGKVVFIWDLAVYAALLVLITLRFARGGRARLVGSLTNPAESLFVPCVLLSLATIIPSAWVFGRAASGAWLAVAVRVLFWVYAALAVSLAVAQYALLFSGVQLTIQSMTPAWLLPIFPVMLSGTVAGTVAAADQPPAQALPIAVAGVTLQGLGFWFALTVYALYVLRLMANGFPVPDLRPGMFIAVGPPSYTSVAIIECARSLPRGYSYLRLHPEQYDVFQSIALAFAVFIWMLSFFFFSVGAVACMLSIRKMSFHLVWYAFIFPNAGLTLALIHIGMQLESNAILWVGSVMTCVLIAVYLFILGAHARAIYKKEIMWEGRDEDRDS